METIVTPVNEGIVYLLHRLVEHIVNRRKNVDV